MSYKNILLIGIFLFLLNCTNETLNKNKPNISLVNAYANKGFALVYSERLYDQKIISKKIDERSLVIFHKNLKTNTLVKITNLLNKKTLIATVKRNSDYPSFNNIRSKATAKTCQRNKRNYSLCQTVDAWSGNQVSKKSSKTF